MNRLLLIAVLLTPALTMAGEPVQVTASDGVIDFSVHGNSITKYCFPADASKPYFWPVTAPNGLHTTRDWPLLKTDSKQSTDHPHQTSMWFAHGAVSVADNKAIDFWSLIPGHGKIVVTKTEKAKTINDAAVVVSHAEWRNAAGKVMLKDRRTIAVSDLGDAFQIEFRIELIASEGPIFFGDTKEGTFAVRVTDKLIPAVPRVGPYLPAGQITNSHGKIGEANCWGRKAEWVDYSGDINGQSAGISLFDHPSNSVRACWHVRNSGLMSANPFGRKLSGFPDGPASGQAVTLPAGERITLTYAVLTHNGDVKAAKVADRFAQFAQP